ncbi:Gti1/Pac2 family-domain-containing protein [Mycena sp. CBHHK59/15]|nr:Gti1/Pac2 family-domain-containing protein [Mycena sp. CBHHK59/15]
MSMQRPTATGLRVRSPADAHVIFHAVSLGILPMITRRLDTEERRAISSGCVYVWEERGGPNTEPMGLGIERWTDSIRWGPSRVRDEFLFYHEKEPDQMESLDLSYDSDTPSPLGYRPSHVLRENLIKQTYSVFVETIKGRRKWHLIAYFTQNSVDYLQSVDDVPYLVRLRVPHGLYKSARSAKGGQRRCEVFAPYAQPGLRYDPVNNARQQWSSAARTHAEDLAPLVYLENMPPLRRHPVDEKALMSFVPALT